MVENNKQLVSANEIIPGLWLGNEEASQDLNFLKTSNITVIVNATKHIPCRWEKYSGMNYYRVPVNDPGPANYVNFDQEDNVVMLYHLPFVLEFIRENLNKNRNVLVHCHAGIQRSATVVLMYLMTFIYAKSCKKNRLRYSIRHILKTRPIVFYSGTGMSFRPAILQYVSNL